MRGLELGGNPWKEPPEAVVMKGMQAASEYFADLFAEGVTDRRNMIKVVLVGQEGAGKTRWVLAEALTIICFGVGTRVEQASRFSLEHGYLPSKSPISG